MKLRNIGDMPSGSVSSANTATLGSPSGTPRSEMWM